VITRSGGRSSPSTCSTRAAWRLAAGPWRSASATARRSASTLSTDAPARASAAVLDDPTKAFVARYALGRLATHFGVAHTFNRTPVGIYFGEPGKAVPDPYFGGAGPQRTGCKRCGACMVGCREGAKNTLVKNYLWFAERKGVEIIPDCEVTDIRPLGAADGSLGYEVDTVRPGAWLRRGSRTITAKGVVVAAGALGTNRLLAGCKLRGSLPRISDRLGHLVRTNSESLLGVTFPDDRLAPWKDVAISASFHPDPDTHIEFVTYGRHGDFMSNLTTLLTGKGTRVTRPAEALAAGEPRVSSCGGLP